MMLVDLFLPPHTADFVAVMSDLAALARRGDLVDLVQAACPEDMALVGRTCVDVLPYPNVEGEEPLLGTSAVVEGYLTLDRTWDCVSLCSGVEKRVCRWSEWQAACEGTPEDECGRGKPWILPDWHRVMVRKPSEMARLDQHPRAEDHPRCVSRHGVKMMTTLEEWVELPGGYAFSRGFWSREGGCRDLTTTHSPIWHGYSNACRCCLDADL